jgi:hypothetical protein
MMKFAVFSATVAVAAAISSSHNPASHAVDKQSDLCNNMIVPGYSAPHCGYRVAAGARIVKYNIQNIKPAELLEGAAVDGNPKTSSKAAKAKTTDELKALHMSTDGTYFALPQGQDPLGYGTEDYNDWSPSSPYLCGLLCDVSDECNGFTYKFDMCWLFGDQANTVIQARSGGGEADFAWTTYVKTGSAIREETVALDANLFSDSSTQIPNKAAFNCDAYYVLGEPCTADAVPGSSDSLVNNDFSSLAGFSSKLTLTSGVEWAGAAPSAFDAALTTTGSGGLTLETRHDDGSSFTFPAADADCGCDYETYVTSMAAGSSTGYGFYEASFTSTATEFLNAFWFQGPTAEINVLKVENGKASVSYYCFADQDDQTEVTVDIADVDLSKTTTATLFYSDTMIYWLVNGEIVHSVATPTCLQGVEMKPIFSVEVGDNLPSTVGVANGASFGKMNVAYLRSWSTAYLTDNNFKADGLACKIDSTLYGNRPSDDTDPAMAGTPFLYGGLYKGPVPTGHRRWQAFCGQRLVGKRKFKTAGKRTIKQCGDECAAYPGCQGFWWSLAEDSKCRLYGDFVPQALDDAMQDASKYDNQGNVWMRMSEGVPATKLECEGASNFDGFTEYCYRTLQGFGPRASIDIDANGLIDYGCPYDKSEFLNGIGNRAPKQCKKAADWFVTNADGTESDMKDPASVKSGNTIAGYIKQTEWDETRVWGTRGALGPLTADLCVEFCKEECSCYGAYWRFDKNHCWMLAKANTKLYRSQAAPPPTNPIRMLKSVVYVKNDPENSGCDVDALKSAGKYSV